MCLNIYKIHRAGIMLRYFFLELNLSGWSDIYS